MNENKSVDKPRRISVNKGERGASLVDYALVLAIVAVGSIGALSAFNSSIRKLYCERVLQFSYAEKEGGGNLDIVWDDSNPREMLCLRPEDIDNNDEEVWLF